MRIPIIVLSICIFLAIGCNKVTNNGGNAPKGGEKHKCSDPEVLVKVMPDKGLDTFIVRTYKAGSSFTEVLGDTTVVPYPYDSENGFIGLVLSGYDYEWIYPKTNDTFRLSGLEYQQREAYVPYARLYCENEMINYSLTKNGQSLAMTKYSYREFGDYILLPF